MDQREALLVCDDSQLVASDPEAEEEGSVDEQSKEKERETAVSTPQEEAIAGVREVSADDSEAVQIVEKPDAKPNLSDEATGCSAKKGSSSKHHHQNPVDELVEGVPRMKKRRVSVVDPVAKNPKTIVSKSDDIVSVKHEPRPVGRRVVRTSVPSKKYLETSRHAVHEFSTATPSRAVAANSQTSVSSQQPRRISTEQIYGTFEQKLRDSVRMHQDIGVKSLSITRKRQLPRLSMPLRQKSHWDYLLEEMKWMATDFAQERNWKRVMQYHLAKDVIVAQNAERVRQEKENRQVAREIALQVSAFWHTMERIAARSSVRFEAGGSSTQDEAFSPPSKVDLIDKMVDKKHDSSSPENDADISENEAPTLQYKKIVLENGSEDNHKIQLTMETMKNVVNAGKAAREAMSAISSAREDLRTEEALRQVQLFPGSNRETSGGTAAVLSAFQVLSLRWMLALYTAGLNMLVNDQLGMGKAATISAFLYLIELVHDSDTKQSVDESAVASPHLLIVAEEELHKWRFYLNEWHQKRKIQLYTGTPSHRKQLQREWTKKFRTSVKDEFLTEHTDLDELDDDEDVNEPVFCVLCPVKFFLEDHEDFLAVSSWQMLIVENEFDLLFEDPTCLDALKKLPQQKRRILCHGQPVENWKSGTLRLQYAEFLVCDSAPTHRDSDSWYRNLLVEKASAVRAMHILGKTNSAMTSLWNTSTDSQYVNPLLLGLHCLGLRRVRSEVEPQLGKIEEQSISCSLTASQIAQYRNAITGFASSVSSEDGLDVWLQLFLRLRTICNCVDLVNDIEKLAHADMRLMFGSSTKLEAVSALLARLVVKEEKRVVIYCQLDAMFPILEMYLMLAEISFVRITGTRSMQHQALYHFASRPTVRVALASTRLSSVQGRRAMSVYGGDAIIVLDSDWNATCDAKLRAGWARTAVAKDLIPVYRLHCEHTIEASLLRVGACLSEKVFGEMSPHELLSIPADGLLDSGIEKPRWWTTSSAAGAGGVATEAKIGSSAQHAEEIEGYGGSIDELEYPLIVYPAELDAEEHLLLANTDELTPVEWYAVSYVHDLTDRKRQSPELDNTGEVGDDSSNGLDEFSQGSNQAPFERIVSLETQHLWQDGDAQKQLFYEMDTPSSDMVSQRLNPSTFAKVLSQMRMKGAEVHYKLYKPPEPLSKSSAGVDLPAEPGDVDTNQMAFHVSYRIPAPPPPPVKLKTESSVLQGETPLKPMKTKKQRNSASTASGSGRASGQLGQAGTTTTGVKRKLDHNGVGGSGLKSGSMKEQRLDLDGIPLPTDVEFEDDAFWGNTNLDEIDSVSWDDARVLTGILGSSIDSSASTGSTGAAIGTPSTSGSGGQRSSSKKLKNSGAGGTTSNTTKRKGSMSSFDSGRDNWTMQDDLVLKKLFELYGSNWTLIAQVFNSTTAVSRFFCKKRSPRQCYDRYGKIISGSLASSGLSSTASVSSMSQDIKGVASHGSSKQPKASAMTTISQAVLDARIGLPVNEFLLLFPVRHSLPGLPPPSVVNTPTLVEMAMKRRKQQATMLPSSETNAGGGLDDLKSIKNSFDAIIQCMKRKTAQPSIPVAGVSPTSAEMSAKASLTVSGPSSKSSAKPASGVLHSSTASNKTVPSPHKSYVDMIALLPNAALSPDDVIKRGKEAAAVAVEADAAVASGGRDSDSVLRSPYDTFPGSSARKSLTVAGVTAAARGGNSVIRAPGGTVAATNGVLPHQTTSTKLASTPSSSWGDVPNLHHSTNASAADDRSRLNTASSGMIDESAGSDAMNLVGGAVGTSLSGGNGARNPMPVTTSTLLHVLDRMPEIKNKIQSILNRNDCSEAQKVAMIARLLSNTNAISNPNVLGNTTPVVAGSVGTNGTPPAGLAGGNGDASLVASALSSSLRMGGNSPMPGDLGSSFATDTPIPMPASLAEESTPSVLDSNRNHNIYPSSSPS